MRDEKVIMNKEVSKKGRSGRGLFKDAKSKQPQTAR
jgi:hypothetical protein